MKRFAILTLLLSFLLISLASAALPTSLHLNIQTTDNSGNIVTGTFNFQFNISSSSACMPVLYSQSSTVATDVRGIVSITLANTHALNYSDQYYLCYYRDGILKSNNAISNTPYTYRARNVTWDGVESKPAICYGNGSGCLTNGTITGVLGDSYITNGSSTGVVVLRLNETRLNTTIDNRISLNIFYYNQTLPALSFASSINTSIMGIITSNNASWLSTYNSTYAQWAYNQTSASLSPWINSSANQIVVDESYTGDVNISGRNFIMPGRGRTVTRELAPGDIGIELTGEVTDGFICHGATNVTGVFNAFCLQAGTYFLPQDVGKSYWGVLSNSPILGFTNASELVGFNSGVRSDSDLFPYTATLQNLTHFKAAGAWNSGGAGNVTNYVGFKYASVEVASGNITNEWGLKIEDVVAGLIKKNAIETGRGLVTFNGRTNITDDGNITATMYFGNGSALTGVCHSASDPGCGDGAGGNPFNQQLNTSYGVIFRNITINSSLTDTPLLINIGVNASVTGKNIFQFLDNQSLEVASLTSGGKLTVTGVALGRSLVFDPVNGAIDIIGSSLNFNRFTLRNMVVGGTGSGGVSASLLVGNGVGNTNFGSELGKMVVGVVGNNSRLFVAKGGLGQTKSVYSVLNFSDTEVFNVTTRGEVQASNVTIRELLKLNPATLPVCANAINGSIARNITDNKPYYCDGIIWNVLY